MRIAAGAFGDGLPRRDLVVSPGHGLFFADATGGYLIPAGCLVNGRTIVREPTDEIDYLHVELARHDICSPRGCR